MRKLTHSKTEIIKSVNELEAGISADEICRWLNVSRATIYQWKRKYGGLEVNQLKKLKELEEENAKLKKMYANLALDNEVVLPLRTNQGRFRRRGKPGRWIS